MFKFLSKKIILIIITLLVVVIIFFTVSYVGKNNRLKELDTSNAIQVGELSNFTGVDKDSDGLKDWEEALWGTDINNPDTDGDGTLDGEEVMAGRNPVVAGPDDEFTNDFKKIYSQETDDKTPITHTEKLSRELIKGYVALKQNNALGTASQDNFISTINTIVTPDEATEKYTKDDIIITKETDIETLQTYADKMAIVFAQNTDPGNSATILTSALKNQNEKELKKIDAIQSFYKEKISQMLSIKTPEAISDTHLALINNFVDFTKANQQMQAVFSDPLLGLSGVTLYADVRQSSVLNARNLGTYFLENGLIFNN